MQVSRRYCNSEDDARSLTNNAFLKLLQSLEKFDTQKPFKPWMRTIAIRLAIDAHRKRERDSLIFQDDRDENAIEIDVPASILSDMELYHIEAAIEKLEETDRLVFNLFVVEGYEHAEIADFLEISTRTSKRCLQRAKLQLRDFLMNDAPQQKAI